MILHIAKKEIHHNLTTLRFALMIILLPPSDDSERVDIRLW